MDNRPKTGWVYVLKNDSMSGLVKIGFTTLRPEERAKSLEGTGVPTPYIVATAFLFSDKVWAIEQAAHNLLEAARVSTGREFFRCSPEEAAMAILEAADNHKIEPVAVEPKLLSDSELEAEHERKRLRAEMRKPCQRFYWVQPFKPYEGHGWQPYCSNYPNVFEKGYSRLLWCFTDCDCQSCKEGRLYKRENPTDYKTHALPPDRLDRLQSALSNGVDLSSYGKAAQSFDNQIQGMEDLYMIQAIQKFESLDENGKSMFMQRYRIFARDFEYLSREEIDLVECDKGNGVGLFGVEWEANGGGWASRCNKGFLHALASEVKGVGKKHIDDPVFPCKKLAIQHFKRYHKDEGGRMSGPISRVPCHCDACRKIAHHEQTQRNNYANSNK